MKAAATHRAKLLESRKRLREHLEQKRPAAEAAPEPPPSTLAADVAEPSSSSNAPKQPIRSSSAPSIVERAPPAPSARRVGSFGHHNAPPPSLSTAAGAAAAAAGGGGLATPVPAVQTPYGERPRKTIGLANDYCQHFVDTNERPQNFVQGADPKEHYNEHPVHRKLRELKYDMLKRRMTPALSQHIDLKTCDLGRFLQSKFDVILIDPPMEEYLRRNPQLRAPLGGQAAWTWNEIANLRIEDVAASQSFLFLWVGCEEGLEEGRKCLNKWGFRRVEDFVWLKSNKHHQPSPPLMPKAALQHTKEHCLMGVRGTVRRSEDGHIIHANCDTDVIIAEDPGLDSTRKPEELYDIIEHFSMGRRRLELFGEDHNVRQGWVTLGLGISSSTFNPVLYDSFFDRTNPLDIYVGSTREIEDLRPKSPPPEGASRNVALPPSSQNVAPVPPAFQPMSYSVPLPQPPQSRDDFFYRGY